MTAPAGSVAEGVQQGLAAVLSRAWQDDVTVTAARPLSGGASMETWQATVHRNGSERPVILRRDRPGRPQSSRVGEARLLELVGAAGVPVPEVLATGSGDELGADYLVCGFLEGETIPRRLLREQRYAAARPRVLGELAVAMAATHSVPAREVAFLGPVQDAAGLVAGYAASLAAVGEPSPALELAIRWLLRNLPEPVPARLVHGDVRNGNLMVDERGLVALLDWELAHPGDPREDLGWLCVRSWRFGDDEAPAGGFGTRQALLDAYHAAGGISCSKEVLRFWEVFGTLKWGVICCSQAALHLSGQVPSLELASIGRRLSETEYDILTLLEGEL